MTRVLPSVTRHSITKNIKSKWNIIPIIVLIFQIVEYTVQYISKKEYIVGYIHESSFAIFSTRDAINYLSSFNAGIILFS